MTALDDIDLKRRAETLSCWRGAVSAEPLGGGLTNTNFLVRDGGERFVVRIGGDIRVHQVMRFNELAASRAAHAAGLAPEIVHHEPGVLVMRYIEGRVLSAQDMRSPNVLPRAAALLRCCHTRVQGHLRGPALIFWPFHIFRDYAATLRESGSRWIGTLPRLLEIAGRLELTIGAVDIVFAHNDLLPSNLIDDGTRLWLIDWEYAGFGSALFDLANLATNTGLGEDEEDALLRLYCGSDPEPAWRRAYAAMRSVSLLRETMWGMVSEVHSPLAIDYRAYAADHLHRFELSLARLGPEASLHRDDPRESAIDTSVR